MGKEKVLKPIEKFLEDYEITLSLKVFFEELYLQEKYAISKEEIEDLIDREGLEEFAKILKSTKENLTESELTRLADKIEISSGKIDSFYGDYLKSLKKSYNLKISKFFNELFLVFLAIVIPTMVQLYVIDDFSILSTVWLMVPFTFFPLLRESNILEFISVNNRYKPMIVRDYFRNLFKAKNKFLAILLFPYYIIKWLLVFLHSFIFQYKIQVLFYTVLAILFIFGYKNGKEIWDSFIHNVQENQVTNNTTSVELESENQIQEDKEVEEEIKILTLSPIVPGEIVTNSEGDVINFEGNVSQNEEQQIFSYTAIYSGNHRFEFISQKENIYVEIREEKDGEVLQKFYREGGNLELKAGEEYEIIVGYVSVDTDFNLSLFLPKQVLDVSDATTVDDSFDFTGQENYYSYTASMDGRHSFYINDIDEVLSVEMVLLDSKGEIVAKEDYQKKFSANLNKGDIYRLNLIEKSNNNLGAYQLNIGVPKNIEDVTGYNVIKDSVEYIYQTNIYRFIPKISGVYGFSLSDKMSNSDITLIVYDKYNEILFGDNSYSKTSGTVKLEANQEYFISVTQEDHPTEYSLNIGYAKNIVDVSDKMVVEGEVTFSGEEIRYSFTPSSSNKYRLLTTKNINAIFVNKYNETSGSYSGWVELEKGETYTILLTTNSNNLGNYKLTVEESN